MTIDPASSVHFEPCAGSTDLFIGFAGMQLYIDPPNYQWRRSFAAVPANRLFVRDLAQFWYLRGLAGIPGGIDGGVDHLRRLIDDHHIERIVCFGASIGGYAALLFGSLLGAAEVHAFSAMTRLPSRKLYELVRLLPSHNWTLMRKSIALRLTPHAQRHYFDLRPIMLGDNGRTAYHLHYARGHTPDRRNALLLAGLPRVTHHEYDYNKHYLVEKLKQSNELAAIVAGALPPRNRVLSEKPGFYPLP